jgi:hypothetical protein
MNKLRSALASIALALTLLVSGLFLPGLGSVANVASSHHASSVSSALVVGKSTAISARPNWPCPSGSSDC